MIKNIKILMATMLLGSTAQAAIVVTYNPPLTLGVVERFSVSNSGTDVTSNYTIQSIAADPVSGYVPVTRATLFRASQAGSFTITYVSNVDSSTFTDTAIMTATPAYIQLSSGAGQSANTGTALAQPISVLVSDASANPVSGATVTWSITGAGGTFSPSVTNSLGVASTTLTMGTTPGTYNVTATAGAIASTDVIQAISSPATNQLTNLLFQTQPASRAQKAIVFATQPVLFLSNGSSAAYTTPTTVTASAFNNSACSSPAIGTLSGTLSVQSNAAGVASFTDLVYSTNDAIFLKFSAGTLSACSNLMNIVSQTTSETKLTLNFTPTSAYVGTQFNFLVNVSDVSGNIVGSATNLVSVAPFTDATCTTAAIGTLTGNTPINAYQGQALFNSLNYSKVEGLYFLATATGLTSVCSPLVTLKANPINTPTAIAFYYAPSSEFAGQIFSVQPFTSVKNTLGSVVQPNSSPITIAAYSDAACSVAATGTLSGTKNLASIYGVGSFTNLSYSNSGTIYLGISSPGLTSDCSAAVTMNATALSSAAKLKFTVQPSSSGLLNTFFTTQPSVEVDDNSGAVVSSIQGFVAINWFTDTSCLVRASGIAESDTRLVNGVSAFSYLGGNTIGTYYLGATFNNLAVACSAAVTINPSSPTCTGTVHLDVASNTCQLNTQSCSSIPNGTGTQTWTGSGSIYSSCAVASCNTGFSISGNSCVAQVSQLVFRQQPSSVGSTSAVLSQQPIIETDDATGSITSATTPPITLTAYSDTCVTPVSGGLIATTNPLTTSSGSATFTGVQVLRTNVNHIGASDGTHSVCSIAMTVSGTGWVGASNGVWSLASNWSPATVPNSTSAVAVFNALSSFVAVTVDANETVNQLNMVQDTTSYTISGPGKITFDGTSPSLNINSSKAQTISAPLAFSGTNPSITVASSVGQTFSGPIVLNSDTSITTTNNGLLLSGDINENGKNISFSSAAQGIRLTSYTSTMVGGTLNLVKGGLTVEPAALGGAGGPKIIISNLFSGTKIGGNSSTPFVNNIQLNDTGTNPFIFNGPFRSTGSIAGNITHDFIVTSGNSTGLAGDLSGLVFSNGAKLILGQNENGQIIFSGGLSPSFQSNVEIDIGSGETIGEDIIFMQFNSNSNIANPIKVRPGTVTPGRWAEIAAGAGGTYTSTNFTGNIVLNSDGNAAVGSHLITGYYGGPTAFKISGVMSNGASGAANIDFNVGNLLTLSGANTYTSPTFIGLFSPWSSYGFLNLTGSINSSLTTINAKSILYHSGTINGNVSAFSGSTINAGSVDFSQPVTSGFDQTHLLYSSVIPHDGIVNGNFTSAGSVIHRFGMGGGALDSKLIVNGNIALAGSVVPISIAPGTHTLVTYTGTRTGTFGTSVAGQVGSIITYDDVNKKITATINSPLYYNLVNSGNFSSSQSWEAGAPPISDTVNIVSLTGSAGTSITLNQNETLNHLDVSTSAKTLSGTQTLTFGGTNATLSGSIDLTISAPIKLAADLAITGTGPFTLSGAITNSGYNINQTATSTIFSGSSSMIGGVYDLISGALNVNSATGLGGASGMTIKVENTSANTSLQTAFNSFVNPVILNDTGTNNFTIKSTGYGLFYGSITGNLTTNNLLLSSQAGCSLGLYGDMSGLNLGGLNGRKIIVGGPNLTATIGSSTFPACTVDLGTGVGSLGNNSITFSNGGTYTNNFNILGNTSSSAASNTITGASSGTTIFSGNMIVNSNSSTFAGNTATFAGGSGGTTTFSGVISNAGNPTNVTVGFAGTGTSITGNNTYTSNTQISGGGGVDISGSISNSPLINVANSSGLYLTGATGAVTTGSGSALLTYRNTAVATPTATSVATINGNLSMIGASTYYVKTGASNTSSLASVTGNVSLGSATVSILTPTTGTFTLMTWTGTRTGNFGAVSSPGKTSGAIVYDDVSMPRKATITLN